MIPYGRHEITEEDISAVTEVLRSERITQGSVVPAFEASMAEYCDAEHAVAVTSGTAALHLACLALGLGSGDRLWTTPISFVASANCARYCGAEVDFVDIDPDSLNISVSALHEKLLHARAEGSLPKVVVPVHFAGRPCDMEAIADLAEEFGFAVIEDASHALGASYSDSRIGSCRYSAITVFSFHPVKAMTTGEGGMVMTNDGVLAGCVRQLRSHGITRDVDVQMPWYYEQTALGFNYRMTDIQAALGMSQLQRLDGYIESRKRLAQAYDTMLQGLPLILPACMGKSVCAWHLYVIQCDVTSPLGRNQLYHAMHDAGIAVNVHYIPIHTQPYYRELGFYPGQYPAAERYYGRCLTLPLYATLSDGEQGVVVDTLR